MGSHDDQVDAASSAFNRLNGGTTGMLDWIQQQLEASRTARADDDELDEKVKRDGFVALHGETTDQSLSSAKAALRANLENSP